MDADIRNQGIASQKRGGVGSGAALKSAREKAGLSQGALARQARVAQSAISAFEAGKREPTMEVHAKLAAVLPELGGATQG